MYGGFVVQKTGRISDRNCACFVPRQQIDVEVPIHCEAEIVYERVSAFNFSPPSAEILGGSLRIVIEIPHDAADRKLHGEKGICTLLR